jgi:hypothetical protein
MIEKDLNVKEKVDLRLMEMELEMIVMRNCDDFGFLLMFFIWL